MIVANETLASNDVGVSPFARPAVSHSQPFKSIAERIEATVEFMERHFYEPLQVSRLAALANVSASHFFVLFKRQTGRTPIQFFTEVKMTKARDLLSGTSLSVKEVAGAVGYDDPFYFSRVFKAHHDIAPSDFRRTTLHPRNGNGEDRSQGELNRRPLTPKNMFSEADVAVSNATSTQNADYRCLAETPRALFTVTRS